MKLTDAETVALALALFTPVTILALVALLKGYSFKVWRERHRDNDNDKDKDD